MQPFTVTHSTLDMVEQLAAVQRACFPSLAHGELIRAEHYAAHIRRFPEGQLAVLDGAGRVVACSTDFRTRVDWDHWEHRFFAATGENWLSTHDPAGDWLYGADIGVLPAVRGQGLSRLLYEARQALIRRLRLRGHVAGGVLAGYGRFRGEIAVEEYVERVIAGEFFDPTLSVQLRRGFRVHGIIHDYLDDPACDNKAAFIVWHNPDYRPEASG